MALVRDALWEGGDRGGGNQQEKPGERGEEGGGLVALNVLFIGFGVSRGHGMNPESRLKGEKDEGYHEEASGDLFSVSHSVSLQTV